MKQKFLFLMALFSFLLMGGASMWAGPKTSVPVVGNSYYLYNPKTDCFLKNENGIPYVKATGDAWTLEQGDGEYSAFYTLKVKGSESDYFWGKWWAVVAGDWGNTEYTSQRYFKLAETTGGYTLSSQVWNKDNALVYINTGNSNRVAANSQDQNGLDAAYTIFQFVSEKDYAAYLKNAAVTSTDGWAGGRINSGEQYTDAPDDTYLDAWNDNNSNMSQQVTLPLGIYKLQVATRADANVSGHIYVLNLTTNKDMVTSPLHKDGNSGGELGNGWSWNYLPFYLAEETTVQIGFYAPCGNKRWAGADDFRLYYYGSVNEQYKSADLSNGIALSADTWYKVTIGTAGLYRVTSSDADIRYVKGIEDIENTETISTGTGNITLEAGDYYFKAEDATTLTISTFQIATLDDLILFSKTVNAGYTAMSAELTADIVDDGSFEPIGTDANRYHGTFDGKGHSITLAINNNKKEQGLFSVCSNATIQNVTVKGSVTSTNTTDGRAAGIVAICNGTGTLTIDNCHNEANITTGYWNAAGILGCNYNNGGMTVSITNCSNSGTISGTTDCAAICGWTRNVEGNTITGCSNTGTITSGYTDGNYLWRGTVTTASNNTNSVSVADLKVIKNPSFDECTKGKTDEIEGWDNASANGMWEVMDRGNAADPKVGTYWVEKYGNGGKIDLSQTINNLPAGLYEVSVLALDQASKVKLIIESGSNKNETAIIGGDKATYTTTIMHNEGGLKIGLYAETHQINSWVGFDDFHLKYLGFPEVTTDDVTISTDKTYVQEGNMVTVSAEGFINVGARTEAITFGGKAVEVTNTQNGFTFVVPEVTMNSEYTLTIPAKSMYSDGKFNAEKSVTFKTPAVKDGTYFLQNEDGQFLSRGNSWGTRACGDEWGSAIKVTTDENNVSHLQFADNNCYLFAASNESAMWTDETNPENDQTKFTIAKSGDKYTLTAATHSDKYVYLPNFGDGAGLVWSDSGDEALWTLITDNSANRQKQLDAKAAAVAQAASIEGVESVAELETAVAGWATTNVLEAAATITEAQKYQQDISQEKVYPRNIAKASVEVSVPGLYKFTIRGFHRMGNRKDTYNWHQSGQDVPTIDVFFGNNKVRVKSLFDEQPEQNYGDGCKNDYGDEKYYPDNQTSAQAAFQDGLYVNTIWMYINEAGTYDYGFEYACNVKTAHQQWTDYSMNSATLTRYTNASYELGSVVASAQDGNYIQTNDLTFTYPNAASSSEEVQAAVMEGAKATVNGTEVEIQSVEKGFKVVLSDEFIPSQDYSVVIPTGVYGFANTNEKNEAMNLTVHTTVLKDGTYYLYNPYKQQYMSRGGVWATSGIFDDYGLAINLRTDAEGMTTFQFFDNQRYLFNQGWTFGDGTTPMKFKALTTDGGYEFQNMDGPQEKPEFLAHWGGRIVNDGRKGENLDGTSNVWILETVEEHKANYSRNADKQVAALGIDGVNTSEALESLIAESYGTTDIKINGKREQKFDEYAAQQENHKVAEYYKETVENLQPGLYKLSVDAFQRAAGNDVVTNAGGARGLIYLYANDVKTQLKSVFEYGADAAYSDDYAWNGKHYPNHEQSGYAALATGKYNNVVYVNVAADEGKTTGTLTIGINNPVRQGNGLKTGTWCVYTNCKLERLHKHENGESYCAECINVDVTDEVIKNADCKDNSAWSGSGRTTNTMVDYKGENRIVFSSNANSDINTKAGQRKQEITIPATGNYKLTTYVQVSGNNAYVAMWIDDLCNAITVDQAKARYTVDTDGNNTTTLNADGKGWIANDIYFHATKDETKTIYMNISAGSGEGHVRYAYVSGVKLTYLGEGPMPLTLDEAETFLPVVDATANVTMARTMKADVWNTFCVPFSMTAEQIASQLGEDAEVKKLSGVKVNGEDYVMQFAPADAIEAGVPYMVKVSEAITELAVEGVKVKTTVPVVPTQVSDNGATLSFTGNYSKMAVPEGSYIISNNLFYTVGTKTVTNKGYRGYLTTSAGSNARVSYVFDDEETDINAITDDKLQMTDGKYIENGKIVIVKNGVKYNINGIRQ